MSSELLVPGLGSPCQRGDDRRHGDGRGRADGHGCRDGCGQAFWHLKRPRVPAAFRYLRRLHFSLKKGRWNASEEGKLLELIEKYGVGESWASRRHGSQRPQPPPCPQLLPGSAGSGFSPLRTDARSGWKVQEHCHSTPLLETAAAGHAHLPGPLSGPVSRAAF